MEHHHEDTTTLESPRGRLYTLQEVAAMLRVTPRGVQAWIQRGELPAIRYGRILRVRHDDLAAFGEVLNAHPAPSTEEPGRAETART